jgi:hypothetical protein
MISGLAIAVGAVIFPIDHPFKTGGFDFDRCFAIGPASIPSRFQTGVTRF